MARKRYECGVTNRIPSFGSQESIGVAARVTTKHNVLEAPESAGVYQRIDETKRVSLVENTEVINQREYGRHCLDIGSQLGA